MLNDCLKKVKRIGVILLFLFSVIMMTTDSGASDLFIDNELSKIKEMLKEIPLIDGHNDAPYQFNKRFRNRMSRVPLETGTHLLSPPMHTDIPRLKKGGVGAQFWISYASPWGPKEDFLKTVNNQIDIIHSMIEHYPDTFTLALTSDEIESAHDEEKIASLIGVEGGYGMSNSLAVLRQFYRSGVRYMTLTHWLNTDWADAGTDTPIHNGLTGFGLEVVREMNRMGMMVDLSHTSYDTMHDALNESEAPVIFSHANAASICPHPRNIPDDILYRLKENNGIIMVTFVPGYVSKTHSEWSHRQKAIREHFKRLYPKQPEKVASALEEWEKKHPKPLVTIRDLVDHIDHIKALIGIDHIGIGSDFDGISDTIKGLEDVSAFPALFVEMAKRGYSLEEMEKIACFNFLRVFRKVEAVSKELKRTRLPSEVLFEDFHESSKQLNATEQNGVFDEPYRP